MDDSCAVCADTLEWVAYGACGHRDVCSTCVARLRFICEDRRCCICKTECAVVFVTKALGDYTRMVNDFSVFPSEAREGRVGLYWYHEDTQLFFDDVDHYRMIKAMCRLSCSVCDNMEEQPNEGTRRRQRFRNIEQLKGHLFHRHRLSMCGLCLEGRKVFICEQKLYTRAQLNQHVNTGDSEVDGTESERGGFMGHPMCEFCRTPFYGDNELYSHMSTEHYTCHLCQRQHPGQYEYYKNYDDLEIHFRGEHFLCEDEGCLAKKFIVFQSEAEMKRHNAIEHGGRMSRAKRNAVLQIPTSFRFRRNNEDNRRARGRALNRDTAEDQLSMAIQASLETASASGAVNEPSPSSAQPVSNHEDTNDVDPLVQPFESLTTADSETSVRYLQALGHSRNAPLQESSFPPLATGSSSSQQKSSQNSEGLPNNTMAARLRRRNKGNVSVLNSGKAWASTSRGPVQPSNNLTQQRPMTSVAPSTSWSSGMGPNLPGSLSTAHTQPQPQPQSQPQPQPQPQPQARPTTVHGNVSSASLTYSGKTSGISHSASAPNLIDNGSKGRSVSDFPPVSALQIRKLPQSSQPQLKAPSSGQPIPNVEDVQSANRSLVEKMRAAFGYDEDKYTAFKDISGQYRQGLIDAGRYLAYVREYGLTHLVLELARLCPDPEKQKELIDSYNASQESNGQEENGWGHGNIRIKSNNNSKKNKGKSVVVESSKSKDTFADNFLSSVRELQTSFKPAEEATEGLSKDGYRGGKGKSMVSVNEQLRNQIDQSVGGGSNQTSVDRNGGGKQRKKTSKFHRVRLGDGSISSLLDVNNSGSKLDPQPLDGNKSVGDGVPVRGVWRKGGGHKLFS